jgi:uncharacterized membrane protein
VSTLAVLRDVLFLLLIVIFSPHSSEFLTCSIIGQAWLSMKIFVAVNMTTLDFEQALSKSNFCVGTD